MLASKFPKLAKNRLQISLQNDIIKVRTGKCPTPGNSRSTNAPLGLKGKADENTQKYYDG